MDKLSTLAAANQQRAQEVIRDSGIESIWRSVGAEPHLVGSLRTGLLMTHRDIDFHIYSSPLRVADSFAAMARLAENSRIHRIEYGNLLDTSEECLEWHAWYADADDQLWQIDMIHMPKGSAYDGYFERVADRIAAVLTDQTRETILRLKYETPETEKIMGIEYYQAVLRDGVRTYAEFEAWRAANPVTGVLEWMAGQGPAGGDGRRRLPTTKKPETMRSPVFIWQPMITSCRPYRLRALPAWRERRTSSRQARTRSSGTSKRSKRHSPARHATPWSGR